MMLFSAYSLFWAALSLIYASSTFYFHYLIRDSSAVHRQLTVNDHGTTSKVMTTLLDYEDGHIKDVNHSGSQNSTVSYGQMRGTSYQCIPRDKQIYSDPQPLTLLPASFLYNSTYYDDIHGKNNEELEHQTNPIRFSGPAPTVACKFGLEISTGPNIVDLKRCLSSIPVTINAVVLYISKHQISYNIIGWILYMSIIFLLFAYLEEKPNKIDLLRQEHVTLLTSFMEYIQYHQVKDGQAQLELSKMKLKLERFTKYRDIIKNIKTNALIQLSSKNAKLQEIIEEQDKMKSIIIAEFEAKISDMLEVKQAAEEKLIDIETQEEDIKDEAELPDVQEVENEAEGKIEISDVINVEVQEGEDTNNNAESFSSVDLLETKTRFDENKISQGGRSGARSRILSLITRRLNTFGEIIDINFGVTTPHMKPV